MLVYEDNFGFSNITEPEERAFFDGQGLDLLEIRGWDDAALGVIKV
jgi:hypothetical protein